MQAPPACGWLLSALQLWQYVRERFANDLTLADFRTHPTAGPEADKTGLWVAAACPEVWQYVRERFANDLTLADFRTHPTAGRDAGRTGLWVGC